MAIDEPVRFKYKLVARNGQRQGFFSTQGVVERDRLVLGDEELPLDTVLRAIARYDVLKVSVAMDDGQVGSVVLAVTSGSLRDVRAAVNRTASATWERRRKAEEPEPGAPPLRFETCPHCRSRVDVTGRPRTAQVWCLYCECVGTLGPHPDPDEARYRLCDVCGYYGSPVLFTSFLIWFALVVWGFKSRKMQSCRACMRREAWSMFGKNLLFVVGAPFALVQLIRAYASGKIVEGRFAGLDAANARARAGKTDDAVRRYLEIEARERRPAGVAFSRGLALRIARRPAEAALAFEDALASCANYGPAEERLEALRRGEQGRR